MAFLLFISFIDDFINLYWEAFQDEEKMKTVRVMLRKRKCANDLLFFY